ncbi:hypothetical protein C8Q76DRAFT_735882 [Earliella scabrosa]|nr:hypothetical protein C8Q76DRAFT_735882 [Earliella scabrosa]
MHLLPLFLEPIQSAGAHLSFFAAFRRTAAGVLREHTRARPSEDAPARWRRFGSRSHLTPTALDMVRLGAACKAALRRKQWRDGRLRLRETVQSASRHRANRETDMQVADNSRWSSRV